MEYGRIRVLAFYRRRARRLLPALFALLATLSVYGLVFASDQVRRPMRDDILATLGYVVNWRLILRQDQYFETFGNPSFLRHAWTLSVEEQFYVLVPLLVGLLALLLRRPAVQVGVLLVLGAVSAVWTAHIGVDSAAAQSHAYYGTDTRAQALLVGVALAFVLGLRTDGHGPRRLPPRAVATLGWGGLAAMVYAYLCIEPFTRWMFADGGMLAFALCSAALVLACADPRPSLLGRVLGWEPLAYLGKLSYGLYLWHWPIHLWLRQAMPDIPLWAHVLVGLGLTVLVAALSYELLERPVLRYGVRGLARPLRTGRTVVAGATALLLVAAFTVGHVPSPAAAAATDTGPAVQLVPGSQPYVAGKEQITVGIYGDSVPWKLIQGMPRGRYPDMTVLNLATPGCDLVDLPVRWTPTQVVPQAPECREGKRVLPDKLRSNRADVLVLFTGSLLGLPHVDAGGAVVDLDDAGYRASILAALDRIKQQAIGAGVKQIQLVTEPCRDVRAGFIPEVYRGYLLAHPEIVKKASDPRRMNQLFQNWAGRNGVSVLDLYPVLCQHGYTQEMNGIRLYGDDIHFSDQATPMIWTWLAPQIRDAYERSGKTS